MTVFSFSAKAVTGISSVYRLKNNNVNLIGTCLCLFGFLLCVGCEKVEGEFNFQPETEGLYPAAAQVVKKTLVNDFGTPQTPTIAHHFPVERGGFVAEIEELSADEKSIVTIAWEKEESDKIEADRLVGRSVEFLFDPEEAFDVLADALDAEEPDPFQELTGITVKAYDPKTHQLTFSKPLPEIELIDAGLQLVIDPNHRLQKAKTLYAEHCIHCHGLSGDGNGPTAKYMTPKPRDYRKGVFKFTSTGPQSKASTADLKHIIIEGIPGTYMSSFKMLPEEDLALIVEYVKYLSIRGAAEQALNVEVGIDFSQKVLDEILEETEEPEKKKEEKEKFKKDWEEFHKGDYPEIEVFTLLDLSDAWKEVLGEGEIQSPSVPRTDPNGPSAADPTKSSIENGRLLYLGNVAQCAACHGGAGKGDGFQTRQIQKKPDGSEYNHPGLYDTWGNPTKPRDLTRDIYRGGRRPIDIFRRIYCGIKGTPMPGFGGKGLTDEQIWDVVNYVMSIPYEEQKKQ